LNWSISPFAFDALSTVSKITHACPFRFKSCCRGGGDCDGDGKGDGDGDGGEDDGDEDDDGDNGDDYGDGYGDGGDDNVIE
jgi:hypothetical protein